MRSIVTQPVCIRVTALFSVLSFAMLCRTAQNPAAAPGTELEVAARHDAQGVALAKAGDLAGAIQEFRAALRLDSNSYLSHYHLALALEQHGETDQAMLSFEEALRQNPDLIEARYLLAGCCGKRGDFEGELRLLAEVVAQKPGFAEARYNYGLALKKQDHIVEALKQLGEAAKLSPENPNFLMAWGITLAAQDAKKATEALRNAVRLSPSNAEAHYNLALVLAAGGADEHAVQEFTTALSLNPNHTSAGRGLAVTLMHQGKLQQAVRELQRALEITPNDAETASNLGMMELRLKDTAAAIQWLERAVRLNPQLIKARFNLAQAYQRAGRTGDARRESEIGAELTAQQRNRGRAMVLMQSADQVRQSGQPSIALTRLREAVAADPSFAMASLKLGMAIRDAGGSADEAIEALRQALRLDPESAEAHYEIGLTLAGAGRQAAALEEFKIAVEMAPCRVEMMQAYGRAALQGRHWAEAATQFKSVLARRPNDNEARLGLERAVTEQRQVSK